MWPWVYVRVVPDISKCHKIFIFRVQQSLACTALPGRYGYSIIRNLQKLLFRRYSVTYRWENLKYCNSVQKFVCQFTDFNANFSEECMHFKLTRITSDTFSLNLISLHFFWGRGYVKQNGYTDRLTNWQSFCELAGMQMSSIVWNEVIILAYEETPLGLTLKPDKRQSKLSDLLTRYKFHYTTVPFGDKLSKFWHGDWEKC